MRRALLLALPIGTVLSLALFCGKGVDGQDAAPPAVKIGLLNLKRAIDGSKTAQAHEREIAAYQEKAAAHQASLQEKVDREKGELARLRGDKDAWMAQKAFVLRLEDQLKKVRAAAKREIRARFVRAAKAVYREVCRAAEEYRRRHGFTAILKLDLGEPAAADSTELAMRINMRTVLAADPRLDVTDGVLALMDG